MNRKKCNFQCEDFHWRHSCRAEECFAIFFQPSFMNSGLLFIFINLYESMMMMACHQYEIETRRRSHVVSRHILCLKCSIMRGMHLLEWWFSRLSFSAWKHIFCNWIDSQRKRKKNCHQFNLMWKISDWRDPSTAAICMLNGSRRNKYINTNTKLQCNASAIIISPNMETEICLFNFIFYAIRVLLSDETIKFISIST